MGVNQSNSGVTALPLASPYRRQGPKDFGSDGALFISASVPSLQLVSHGPLRTTMEPRGPIALCYHSCLPPEPEQLSLSAEVLSVETSVETQALVWSPIVLDFHWETEIALQFCAFCVYASAWAKARDSAVSICWHTGSTGSWVPSTAPTQGNNLHLRNTVCEEISPAPAAAFSFPSQWVLCVQHQGWLQCH